MGVFRSDLMRTFKQLKESRAESVSGDVEIIYKRQIEDLCHQIQNYDRDRENLILDLSPSSAFSGNVVPSDFKPADFLSKDIEIGLNKRDRREETTCGKILRWSPSSTYYFQWKNRAYLFLFWKWCITWCAYYVYRRGIYGPHMSYE